MSTYNLYIDHITFKLVKRGHVNRMLCRYGRHWINKQQVNIRQVGFFNRNG